jgi:hypothetical protein
MYINDGCSFSSLKFFGDKRRNYVTHEITHLSLLISLEIWLIGLLMFNLEALDLSLNDVQSSNVVF